MSEPTKTTLKGWIKAIQSPNSMPEFREYAAQQALRRINSLAEDAAKGLAVDGKEPEIALDHQAVAALFIADIGVKEKKKRTPKEENMVELPKKDGTKGHAQKRAG